jgi:hypothetical protein
MTVADAACAGAAMPTRAASATTFTRVPMRYLLVPLAVIVGLCMPGFACAQPKIEKVRIGFKPYNENINFARYKVGLWTPVYVEITAGQNGLGALPGEPKAYLNIVTPDFEGVETIYRTPVKIDPNETHWVVGYTKTGNTSGDIKIDLKVGNRSLHAPPERPMAMDLGGYVYLALGRRVSDLPAALRPQQKDKNGNVQFRDDEQRRAAVFEENGDLLPRHWFGYDGVDMIFLSTDNREFLTKLARQDDLHKEELTALAQWVRRGGRLVIPVSRQTQELTHNLLKQSAWHPPVPIVPPPRTDDGFRQPDRLPTVARWGEVSAPLPNPGEKPPVIAQIEPPDANASDWDIKERAGEDGPPVIAVMRYGMGQIIYLAFSLDDPALTQWPARIDFLRTAITKLAPRGGQGTNNQNQPMRGGRGADLSDVSSQLYNQLDNFDVQVIDFKIVAIFILLYVIIVGPLEFVLLKYVFGRLEWTWVTFPTVVVGVSVIAYFGAYALKGQDLKINKIDVVDFDLRSDLDGRGQPKQARAYGQTYLMILSPRIQSYTVGIEPNPAFWGEEGQGKQLSADVVSWMARPEADNFGGMGSGAGGQGFFRKPYYYGDQPPDGAPAYETVPTGVAGVPIPVWMSKAFTATWETPTQVPPIVADLSYHRNPVNVGGVERDLKLSGTLRSNLTVDLVDVWLFYGSRAYPLKDGLPATKEGGATKVNSEGQQGIAAKDWFGQSANIDARRPNTNQGTYDPTGIVKQMLFHEQFDTTRNLSNHSQRRLDLSWRLAPEPAAGQIDRRTREAILVGRLRFRSGAAEDLTNDAGQPLPTRLWLGALPGIGQARRTLDGTMNQDTFVRVILPVKPAGN